jgi:hypothetical protein
LELVFFKSFEIEQKVMEVFPENLDALASYSGIGVS